MILAGAGVGLGAALVLTGLLYLLLAQTTAANPDMFKGSRKGVRYLAHLGAVFLFVGAPVVGAAIVVVTGA